MENTYEIKKLTAHPYAQARVNITTLADGCKSIRLISYATEVAEIRVLVVGDTTTTLAKVYGLYSATTRKHLSAFFKEYMPNTIDNSFEFIKYIMLVTRDGKWTDNNGTQHNFNFNSRMFG